MSDEDLQIAIDHTRAWLSDVSNSTLQQKAREGSIEQLRRLEAEQVARATAGALTEIYVGGTT
jgi:hypothetical protein